MWSVYGGSLPPVYCTTCSNSDFSVCCVVTVRLLSNQSLRAALCLTSVDKHGPSVSSLLGIKRLLGLEDSGVCACMVDCVCRGLW